MLVSVRIPLREGWVSAYEKMQVRGAIDFPLTGVAVALRREGDLIADMRLACTGVSSRPELIAGLEALAGKRCDDAALALVEKQIKRGTQPMETTVINVSYRRRVTPVLAKRVLRRLWELAA